MKTLSILFFSTVALSLALSACAPAKSDEGMMDKPTESMMMDETATPDEMMMHDTPTVDDMMMHETPTSDDMMMDDTSTSDGMMESPAWFDTALIDVNTGESFHINDFKGKVVFVETMAQWCPSCLKQQIQVKSLHESLGMPSDLITVALDIDPNENADTLKSYASSNGFDWIYAVAPADVAREISNLYGAQFLNPPSTPVLVIDREGNVHPLPFGIKSAEDLMKMVEPYLNGM